MKKQTSTRKAKQKREPICLRDDVSAVSTTFEQGIDSVVDLLRGKKNIVILTGAGISVSCGIPDFRTRGTGLYETLNAEELGLSCPEELFDFEVFLENPKPFYAFARNLYFPLGNSERARPSDAHKLLVLLEEQNMLLRVYSQNIDGLEQIAGLGSKKVVYAHGSLQWATCLTCRNKVNASQIEKNVLNGTVAKCQVPFISQGQQQQQQQLSKTKMREPMARARKRQREQEDQGVCGGILKPGVTFFGEALHDNVRRALEADQNKVDALIVIGTSLSVAPISKVIGYLPHRIPRILINRTVVHPAKTEVWVEATDCDTEEDFRKDYVFDAYLLGFCDDVARELAKRLFSSKTTTSASNGKLLSSLSEDDEHYDIEDWSSVNVPHERVFLFPGAQAPTNDDDESELTYRDVAHCDGCSNRITGTIHKCSSCFDFDLCQKCFPNVSKSHANGEHCFIAEKAVVA